MSPDQLGYADGVNHYVFVQQNPFTYFDPLGLSGVPWHQKALGWSSVESNSLGFRVNDQGQAQARTRQYDHNFFTGGVRNDSGYQWRNAEGTSWESYFDKNPDAGNYKVASQKKSSSQFFNAVAQKVGSYSNAVETSAKASVALSTFAVPAVGVGSKGLSLLDDGVSFLANVGSRSKSLAPALSTFEGASIANTALVNQTALTIHTASQNAAAWTVAATTFLEGFESSASFFSGLSGSNPVDPSIMDVTSFSPHNVFDPGNSFSQGMGALGYGINQMMTPKEQEKQGDDDQ